MNLQAPLIKKLINSISRPTLPLCSVTFSNSDCVRAKAQEQGDNDQQTDESPALSTGDNNEALFVPVYLTRERLTNLHETEIQFLHRASGQFVNCRIH